MNKEALNIYGPFLGALSFSGIFKLSLPDGMAEKIQSLFPTPEGMTPVEKDRLHITLCHQRPLKPYRRIIEDMMSEDMLDIKIPEITMDAKVLYAEQPIDEFNPDRARKSAYMELEGLGSEQLQELVGNLATKINSFIVANGMGDSPFFPFEYVCEAERQHHLTLYNLTGSPMDSIAFPWRFNADEIKGHEDSDFEPRPIYPIEPHPDLRELFSQKVVDQEVETSEEKTEAS